MIGFNGPIPGQSLTDEPKKYAWERPPEFVDPDDALNFHLDRLMSPEVIEAILDLLESDQELFDVNTIVKGILRSGVSNGLYTIDVAMLIGPVIHEFVKQAALAADIEFREGFEADTKAAEKAKRDRESRMAKKALERLKVSPKEAVAQMDEEETPKKTAPKGGRGLMSLLAEEE